MIKPAVNEDTISMVMNPTATTYQKGYLYIPILAALVEGGAGYRHISSVYYDVFVNVKEDRYDRGENVEANITIINKGRRPDRDAIMTVYLKGPDGTIYNERREYFEQVPPTCGMGLYILEQDACRVGDTYYPADKFDIIRTLTLPSYSDLGQWKFVVEYDTQVQDLIIAWDAFEVYRRDYRAFIEMFIILFLVFLLSKRWERKP